MKMSEKILIPIDINRKNEDFLRYSKFFAENWGGEGILIHVIPDILGGYIPYDVKLDELEKMVEEIKTGVESILKGLADQYGFSYMMDVGSPYAKIVDIIKSHGFGMVLVNGGEPGKELGTQAYKIARKSPVPVLVYRHHDPVIRKVLYTTDLSVISESAFPCALKVKERFGARLTALHIVEPITGYFDEGMVSGMPILDIENLKDTAINLMKQKFEGADEVVVEVLSPTADAILEYADGSGFDVIVMATHGRSALEKILLGSVTEKVLRFSKVPVIVSRSS